MTQRPYSSPATTRWTAVAAAAVCLLSAAPLWAAEPDHWSKRLDGLGIDEWNGTPQKEGYEITYLNCYDIGGVEYFIDTVKLPESRESKMRWNLTADQYQDKFSEFRDKGWRVTCVCGYLTKKGARFAAVFVKDNKPFPRAWEARHNQSLKEFAADAKTMRDKGLVATVITACPGDDGQPRYTSLFYEPAADEHWQHKINMTADQYQTQLDKWRDEGYRPRKVYVYDTPDGLRFLAVACKLDKDPYAWEERHDLPDGQYVKTLNNFQEKEYRPAVVSGYLDGGKVKYAALWVHRND